MQTRFTPLKGIFLFCLFSALSTLAVLHSSKNKFLKTTPIYSTAIIGGGVGGLTAAIQLSSQSPILFEGTTPGGLLTLSHSVRNWPGTSDSTGQEIINQLHQHAESSGTLCISEDVISITPQKKCFKVTTRNTSKNTEQFYFASSILLATGTTPRKLSIPGEETYWGKGVSNCAICDGSLYKNKVVAVIGGGEAAIEEAQYLSTIASKVYIIVRKPRFNSHEASRIQSITTTPNVTVLYNSIPLTISGNQHNVTTLTVKNTSSSEVTTLNVNGVFEAIGSVPNSSLVQQIVRCDEQGYIFTDPHGATSVPGIFAAGDVTKTHYRQAIIVAQHATQAALAIKSHLIKKNIISKETPAEKVASPQRLTTQHNTKSFPTSDQAHIENAIIICSHGTGYTAAIYLGHDGCKPLLFENQKTQQPQETTLTTWPGHKNITETALFGNLKKHALAAGAGIVSHEVTNINCETWPYTVTCNTSIPGVQKNYVTRCIIITAHSHVTFTSKKPLTTTAGHYQISPLYETSVHGIFAASQALTNYGSYLTIGAGQEAEAALNAYNFIQRTGNFLKKINPQAPQATNQVKPRPTNIPHITTIAEYKKILQTGNNILIDCFAPWCPPCQRLKPVLERIHKENQYPKIEFYAIDTTEAEELSEYLDISRLPTLIFISNKKELSRHFGFAGEAWLHSLLKNTF